MSGIYCDTDDQGDLWEDFSDVLVAEQRENEPDESYEDYRTARLEKSKSTEKA